MPYSISAKTCTGPFVAQDTAGTVTLFSMGKAQFSITYDATGPDDFTNKFIYFNSALFTATPPPPFTPTQINATGWYFSTVGAGFGSSPMSWLLNDGGRNFTVNINYVSATQIIISGEFFGLMDLNAFASGANDSLSNIQRVLRGSVNDVADLSVSATSIYNDALNPRTLQSYLFVNSTAAPVGLYTIDSISLIYGGFWNRGVGTSSAEAVIDITTMAVDNIKLYKADAVTEVFNIGASETTLVKFLVRRNDTNPITTLPNGIAVLIRTDASNPAVNFYDDVIVGYATIPATDRAITTPASKVIIPGGSTAGTDAVLYTFTIDPAFIQIGGKYRIGVIADNPAGGLNRVTGAFLSHKVYTATGFVPNPIYPDYVSDTIQDYHASYGGSVISCAQARLRSTVTFDRTSYETKTAAAGIAGTYDDLLIDLYFQVLDASNNGVLYKTVTGDPLITRTDAGANTTYSIERRLVHDELPVKTWAGKNLIFQWVQVFQYPTPNGTHTDTIVFPQLVVCRDYDNNSGTPKIVSLQLTDGVNDIGTHCGLASATVKVTASDAAPSNQIAFIDRKFFSTAHLEEEDPLPSTQGFAQLDTLKLAAATDTFTASIATFDIITPMLTLGTQYRVSAIRRII